MIYRAAILAFVLAASGCAMFRESEGNVHDPAKTTTRKIGGRSVVVPAYFARECAATHDLAVARLAAIGQPLRGHTVKRIDLQPGTVLRPKGWAIPDANSPTGYVGAYSTGTRIVLICAPDWTSPNTGALAHEWAENLLLRAKVWSQEERHRIIKKAGL